MHVLDSLNRAGNPSSTAHCTEMGQNHSKETTGKMGKQIIRLQANGIHGVSYNAAHKEQFYKLIWYLSDASRASL